MKPGACNALEVKDIERTGPDSSPYMAIHPARAIFIKELRKKGMIGETTIIENALRGIGYRI